MFGHYNEKREVERLTTKREKRAHAIEVLSARRMTLTAQADAARDVLGSQSPVPGWLRDAAADLDKAIAGLS